jgi:hypothetical protein
MEPEQMQQRIEALELEIKILKGEIQRTLVEIQKNLPERSGSVARWQNKAWILAIVNMLIAIVLFSNIYLYVPGNLPLAMDPTIAVLLRAFWMALAFVWLILQLYPLALLLEQQDPEWQNLAWRNAVSLFRNRPDLLVLMTGVILLVALINSVIPAAWLLLAVILLLLAGNAAVRYMIGRSR